MGRRPYPAPRNVRLLKRNGAGAHERRRLRATRQRALLGLRRARPRGQARQLALQAGAAFSGRSGRDLARLSSDLDRGGHGRDRQGNEFAPRVAGCGGTGGPRTGDRRDAAGGDHRIVSGSVRDREPDRPHRIRLCLVHRTSQRGHVQTQGPGQRVRERLALSSLPARLVRYGRHVARRGRGVRYRAERLAHRPGSVGHRARQRSDLRRSADPARGGHVGGGGRGQPAGRRTALLVL